MHTVAQQIATIKKADRDRLAAELGNPNGSHQLRRVLVDGCRTMTAVERGMDPDDAILFADAWREVAKDLRHKREKASANYADALAVLLTTWAIRMGDIGEDQEEYEFEPIEVPEVVPAEPVPA